MGELIKTGFIGFVSSKAMGCFGKKEYGSVISLITWLYIGYFMVSKAQGWYDCIMSCKLVELLGYIFG